MEQQRFVAKVKSKIVVELDGKQYELNKPTVMQKQEYIKQLTSATDSNSQVQLLIDFVSSLGMPKEVILNMDEDVFMDLFEFINKKKT
jgi:very-short-patch-repair endonuclease